MHTSLLVFQHKTIFFCQYTRQVFHQVLVPVTCYKILEEHDAFLPVIVRVRLKCCCVQQAVVAANQTLSAVALCVILCWHPKLIQKPEKSPEKISIRTSSRTASEFNTCKLVCLPAAEHKCVSDKVVAAVVSPSSFPNPCDGRCPCGFQYPLKIAEYAYHSVEDRRIEDLFNQICIPSCDIQHISLSVSVCQNQIFPGIAVSIPGPKL